MSFHKRHVPNLPELIKQRHALNDDEFARIYSKPDALDGSSESMAYLDIFFTKRQKADTEVNSKDLKM